MAKNLKEILEKNYTLIGLEEEKEEFILTEQEQEKAIENAIDLKKNYYTWKMKQLGYTDQQIFAKIKSVNWLNEIDKSSVLSAVNANKHQDIWMQKQRAADKESQKKDRHELHERCTAKYMYRLMKWISKNELGRDLILHDDNKHLIKTICFFLSADPRFETELNYSFNKGLLIRGVSGVGKTHLIKCVAQNQLYPILILSMIEIADEVKEHGEFNIVMGDNRITYLDDVGTEEHIVNHYGTKINWFKNFVEMYYLRHQVFNKLIISTNNSFDEIEAKYGFRVRSRAKDMFNIIDVKGKDMRG